jgi:MerC mercury resistance protein
MRSTLNSIRALLPVREHLDRAGIVLSGLCALHCVLGIVLVSLLGLGGELLLAPAIHKVGLAMAIVVGAVTLGIGVLRHGRLAPIAVGACGIAAMTAGLLAGHGPIEAMLTIAGVALVAGAHILNLRRVA